MVGSGYQVLGGLRGRVSVNVYIPSILMPPVLAFTRTGPFGFVTVSRKDIGDMSPVTVSIVREIRSRVGGRLG
jgi:hypothetical protein